MLRKQGQIDKAIVHGERAVELESSMPGALSNLGIAYYDKEEFDKAKLCHEKALALNASLPHSLNNMGSIMREFEKPDKAMEYYNRAIAADSKYLEPLNNLGLVLMEEDRHAEGIAPLTNATNQNPNYADAWCNLGCAYTVLEQLDKGLHAYQKAVELKPDFLEAHLGSAQIHKESENLPQAEASIKRALEINPEKAEAYSMLGGVYNEMVMLDKAEDAYKKALELDAGLVGAYLGRSHLHMEAGDFEIAEECLNKALALDNEETLGIRFSFTQLGKVKEDNKHFKALQELKNADDLKGNQAIHCYYAMGKCLDDIGEYERAFEYYLAGAKLKRDTISYDPKANTQSTETIKKIFNRDWTKQLHGHGNPSTVPIFVLGMPRSGTTLTEQIIASHPQVYGAGELKGLKHIAGQLVSPAGRKYPVNLSGLDQQGLKLMGEEYVKRLVERARLTLYNRQNARKF